MIELNFKYSHQDIVISDKECQNNLPFIEKIAYFAFKLIWKLLYWSAIMIPISFIVANPKYEVSHFWPLFISVFAIYFGAYVIPKFYGQKEKNLIVYDKDIVLSFLKDWILICIKNKIETKYYYDLLREIDVSTDRFVLKFKFENRIMLIPESAFVSEVQRQQLMDFLHLKLEMDIAAASA
jgi:hypothetical protein